MGLSSQVKLQGMEGKRRRRRRGSEILF